MEWVDNLFKKVTVDYIPNKQAEYEVHLKFTSTSMDSIKLAETLVRAGFNVNSLQINEVSEPKFEVGSEVTLTKDTIATQEAIVQTPNRCFIFPEVIAPKGIKGKISNILKDSAIVSFEHTVTAKAIDFETKSVVDQFYSIADVLVPLKNLESAK